MAFKFKTMVLYIKNVIEPYFRADRTITDSKLTALDNKLASDMKELNERLTKELSDYRLLVDQLLSKQQETIEKIPVIQIGWVIPWLFRADPPDMECWLDCDGRAINATDYPELVALIGTRLPDLRNRCLQGNGNHAPGTTLEAGLPNITGNVGQIAVHSQYCNGAFAGSAMWQRGYYDNYPRGNMADLVFDASKSNPIYGRSGTVQIPAVVTRFLIRARP